MSRHGYSEGGGDYDQWASIRWAGAVKQAIRGKRGQAFLREMLAALDALPKKELIAGELVTETGECCAMGAVCKSRAIPTEGIDVDDSEEVSETLGISQTLAREIAYTNDDDLGYRSRIETPAKRFARVRAWIVSQLTEAPAHG